MTRHRVGFTLIELLVVIAIVALLISLILPALGRAQTAAKRVACAAQMKQMGVFVQIYVNENNGYLVAAYEEAPWHSSFYGWLLDNKAWHVTVDPGAVTELRGSFYAKLTKCPAEPRPWLEPDDYGSKFNPSYGLNAEAAVYIHGAAPWMRVPLNRLTDFATPGEVSYMIDTRGHVWYDLPHILEYVTLDPPGGVIGNLERRGDRHGGVLNSLFVDGHVDALEYMWLPTHLESVVPRLHR